MVTALLLVSSSGVLEIGSAPILNVAPTTLHLVRHALGAENLVQEVVVAMEIGDMVLLLLVVVVTVDMKVVEDMEVAVAMAAVVMVEADMIVAMIVATTVATTDMDLLVEVDMINGALLPLEVPLLNLETGTAIPVVHYALPRGIRATAVKHQNLLAQAPMVAILTE